MEQLDAISEKLDTIIRILLSNAIEGKNFDEKIITLSNFGLDNKMIAEIIGAKSATIRTRKSQLKSKRKRQ
jgi:hypothetical protein